MTIAQHAGTDRRVRSAALLAGLVQGAALSLVPAAVGWFFIGPELFSLVNLVIVAGVVLVATTGAWFAGFSVLRRRGLGREAAISWWTLGGTVLIAGFVALVVAGIAAVVSMLTIATMWTGDYIEPIVIVAVLVGAASTVLIAVGTSAVVVRVVVPPRPAAPAPLI